MAMDAAHVVAQDVVQPSQQLLIAAAERAKKLSPGKFFYRISEKARPV
jgi:hypothetical protein